MVTVPRGIQNPAYAPLSAHLLYLGRDSMIAVKDREATGFVPEKGSSM
jgi:hypothetical protein